MKIKILMLFIIIPFLNFGCDKKNEDNKSGTVNLKVKKVD